MRLVGIAAMTLLFGLLVVGWTTYLATDIVDGAPPGRVLGKVALILVSAAGWVVEVVLAQRRPVGLSLRLFVWSAVVIGNAVGVYCEYYRYPRYVVQVVYVDVLNVA
jgi:hypothetical protein